MSKHELEELASIVWDKTDGADEDAPDRAAEAIFAAGYRKVAGLAPQIRDVVGILGDDWTGGLSSVEYVRQQREGK